MNSNRWPKGKPDSCYAPQSRKPKTSTFIVGALALGAMALGAGSSGVGGEMVLLAIVAALTGLYIVVTGRSSWARLPGSRKVGGIVLAGSVVLIVVGGIALPPRSAESIAAQAASGNEKRAAEEASRAASASQSPSGTPSAVPTPTPTPTDTGEPLDPATVTELAKGVSYKAPKSQPAYATKALDLLATLPIKETESSLGYGARASYGPAWADVDRNGCDTPNDILKRDLTVVVLSAGSTCKVESGDLADHYTAMILHFQRGPETGNAVQIDHAVALGDAWIKGAQQLTEAQRMTSANDPLNLQATDGPTDVQKGDSDAAAWLPPNKNYHCEYVARQISVKATYGLWVTQAEHDAMAHVLAACANHLVPTSKKEVAVTVSADPAAGDAAKATVVIPEPAAPAPAPGYVAPNPAPAPYVPPAPVYLPPAPAAAYYANCKEVRAAGAAPIYAGQPGYSRSLDRDGDGVGCEK